MFRDEAVVLRRHDFSETSQIASLLTRRHGRRQVLAKGARRERRRGQGPRGIDLLSRMSVTIYPKRGDTLDLLGEWEPLEFSTRVRSNIETLDAALYLGALVECLAPPDEPAEAAFTHLVAGMARLDPRRGRWLGPFFATVLGLLAEFGYLADTGRCVGCRIGLQRGSAIGFSPAAGGVVCERCRAGAPDASPLSAGAWVLLGTLVPTHASDPSRVRVSPAQAAELWRALSRLVHWVAERRLGPEFGLEVFFGRRRRAAYVR